MKFLCQREALLSACQLAAAAASMRDVKPILRNLKLSVGSGSCDVQASDMELGIRVRVDGIQVDSPGELILQTATVIPILRESDDEELTIEADPGGVTIRGANTEFETPAEDPATFPNIPAFDGDAYSEIAPETLRGLIRRSLIAVASTESSRFGATTGVLWELDPNVVLVATDGRRLSRVVGDAQAFGGHTLKSQAVVPAKAMSLLERSLGNEPVKVRFSPNDVLFQSGKVTLFSRLVEGRFPNYQNVVPKGFPAVAELTAGPFMAAIRQAAIMTNDESKRVVFRFQNGGLTLSAGAANSGKSNVRLALAVQHAVDISFDPKFVLDWLKTQDKEAAITMEAKTGKDPAVFRSGAGCLYVVVPMMEG